MSTCIPATNQPFPAFYIYRPGYTVVPLIPLDELPTWIQIGNFDWSNSELYEFMLPASFTCFDRVGEYDVICHHCYAGVDSFHRSVSERSESSAASSRADDQLCHLRAPLAGVVAGPSVVGDLLREETGKLAELRQPPFHASLNSPFVGMCFIPSWLKRTFYPRTTLVPPPPVSVPRPPSPPFRPSDSESPPPPLNTPTVQAPSAVTVQNLSVAPVQKSSVDSFQNSSVDSVQNPSADPVHNPSVAPSVQNPTNSEDHNAREPPGATIYAQCAGLVVDRYNHFDVREYGGDDTENRGDDTKNRGDDTGNLGEATPYDMADNMATTPETLQVVNLPGSALDPAGLFAGTDLNTNVDNGSQVADNYRHMGGSLGSSPGFLLRGDSSTQTNTVDTALLGSAVLYHGLRAAPNRGHDLVGTDRAVQRLGEGDPDLSHLGAGTGATGKRRTFRTELGDKNGDVIEPVGSGRVLAGYDAESAPGLFPGRTGVMMPIGEDRKNNRPPQASPEPLVFGMDLVSGVDGQGEEVTPESETQALLDEDQVSESSSKPKGCLVYNPVNRSRKKKVRFDLSRLRPFELRRAGMTSMT